MSFAIRSVTASRRLAAPLVLALAAVVVVLPLGSASGRATAGVPLVSTGGFSHATATTAVLEGSVNPRTLATTYDFEYGPTDHYGSKTTAASLPAGTSKVRVHASVTGLQDGDHYRLVADNAQGRGVGHDRVYTGMSKKQARKLTKSGFAIPKTYAPILVGGAFTLSGTLTGSGNANREIVLQASRYPYTTPFADVGSPILTASDGRFVFRVPKLSTSTKFRVSTVGASPLYSLIIPQEVGLRVVLKVRSSSQKGLVRLYGTVAPAEVGAHVYFELERAPKVKGPGKTGEGVTTLENPAKRKKKTTKSQERGPTFMTTATTVVKRGTRALSRFSAVVRVPETGNYRAVVLPRVAGAVVAGHSTMILLHAAPSTKKKAKRRKK
ncbi:MAG: hypothetical protein ACRDJX_09390 [Solirubrobacteraceae bacterium]